MEHEKGVEKKEAKLIVREATLATKLIKTPATEIEGEKAIPINTTICLISSTKT